MSSNFDFSISAADNLGIGLFKYSLCPEEKFIVVNSTLAGILDFYSKSDLEKEKLGGLFFNAEDREEFFRMLNGHGKVKFFETTFKKNNGGTIWIAITAAKILDHNNATFAQGIIEDISSHKRMEERLSLERDFLQGLFDNTPDAIYFKDLQNRIIKVNKFYAQGVGLEPEEIVGKTDFDFFPREQAQKMFNDDNRVLSTGKPIVGEIERTLLRNGTWNQVITTKIPMYDKSGNIIGTMGITRDMTAYANLENDRLTMLINALTVLGKALEMRDPYTFSHTRHVARIAERIGERLGWSKNQILGIKLAGELHDLGKISIPLDILNKPGKLTELEYRFVQGHVDKCYDLIKDIEFPFSLAKIIYQHHERMNGSGYPNELKGEEILVEARILAVSDVLESMASYRPYRQALGVEKACEELKNGSGNKYDPKIVEIAFNLINENGGRAFWLTPAIQETISPS